jgi:hypothetical protein
MEGGALSSLFLISSISLYLVFFSIILICDVLVQYLAPCFWKIIPQLFYSFSFLKVHKHEIFLNTFFAETETIWSQGPVTRDF